MPSSINGPRVIKQHLGSAVGTRVSIQSLGILLLRIALVIDIVSTL